MLFWDFKKRRFFSGVFFHKQSVLVLITDLYEGGICVAMCVGSQNS